MIIMATTKTANAITTEARFTGVSPLRYSRNCKNKLPKTLFNEQLPQL